MGTVELTRLAACRGDVVMTIAFMMFLGVSLKKVKKGNKILQKRILKKQGLMTATHGHFDIVISAN